MKSVKGVKKDLEYYTYLKEEAKNRLEVGGAMPRSYYQKALYINSEVVSVLREILGESL